MTESARIKYLSVALLIVGLIFIGYPVKVRFVLSFAAKNW
jgi:hypothetical protein